MVKRPKFVAATAGLSLLASGAAAMAQGSGGAAAATVPATSVAAFYANWTAPKIWFRNGAVDPASNQLLAILKRATFDGLASGPQLAVQVEAALAQAQSGKAED